MRNVKSSININCDPQKIMDAFTEQEMLNGWWGVERSFIEKKVGGVYIITWNISDKGFGYISSGIITAYHPAQKIEISNLVYLNPEKPIIGPMKLTIDIQKCGNETKMNLCQDGYQYSNDWDWYYEAVKDAWPKVLVQLKEYLEKK